jgi:tetratricopeptide (TPR) repeat protein
MSRFVNLEFGGHADEHNHPATRTDDEASCVEEAHAAFRRGDFEPALRLYARVLEFNPRNQAAWSGQVRMLIELSEYHEAKLWADKALEQFPRAPELLAAKAVVLARTGDCEAALAFSDAAVEEQGDTPYVWLARGDVLLACKEKRAEYCFNRALGAAPREWLWPWLASRIHYFYDRFAVALKLISQALALDASQSVIWLQLGKCQLALGLASAAQGSLEQARQLNPRGREAAEQLQALGQLGFSGRLLGWWRRLRAG